MIGTASAINTTPPLTITLPLEAATAMAEEQSTPEYLESDIWPKVQHFGACWLWTGAKVHGYGSIGRKGRVHRIIYEAMIGPIPDGLTIDHLCRQTACCNPTHMEPVTIKVNVLRGEGLTAQNARKTHCVRGHALTPDNVYLCKKRHGVERHCRKCKSIRAKKYYDAAKP